MRGRINVYLTYTTSASNKAVGSMIKPKTDNIVLRRDFIESNKAKFYKAMENLN